MDIREEIRALRQEVAVLHRLTSEQRQLVGPFGLAMPDGTILTQTIHGLHYYIDPTDTVMTPQMVIYRQWEADVTALVQRLTRPGGVFVDVGANFGYFACLAAHAVKGSGGRVFAVEPNPRLVTLLKRNIEINWSIAPVEVIAAAATDHAGVVRLHVPQDRAANGSLSEVGGEGEAIDVPAVRLDDVIPPGVAVDVMKIDVEGHELSVLRGAEAVLERSPALELIVEWSPAQMELAGLEPGDLLDFLSARGYEPFEAVAAALEGELAIARETLMARPYANVLFLRPPSSTSSRHH